MLRNNLVAALRNLVRNKLYSTTSVTGLGIGLCGAPLALLVETGDVMRLLLRQFSKPVVWANLIAWPLTAWALRRWLNGFAYRADLPLWLFPAAALVAILIALGTVTAHSLRVARAKPVTALRYK